jgi:hypothetical protein
MTIFELVFGLWSFSCASIGLQFKLYALGVINVLINGEIEKPSGLCLDLYV